MNAAMHKGSTGRCVRCGVGRHRWAECKAGALASVHLHNYAKANRVTIQYRDIWMPK